MEILISEQGAAVGDRLIPATRVFADTGENRERLGAHLQRRLEAIGVCFNPPGLPPCPSVEIVPPAEWPEVDRERYGVLWAGCTRLDDGMYRVEFRNFRIRSGPMWYPRFFSTALHEGAHLAEWHALLRVHGNKLTWAQWEAIEKLGHGRCFAEIEKFLQHRSVELGFFQPERLNAVPDEVADMFQNGTEG